MKNNTGLIVLVVILSLLVGGLGGFFIYDKVLNTDTDSEITNNGGNNNLGDNEVIDNNNISLDETLKETFKGIYGVYTSPNPYCGKNEKSDKKIEKYTAIDIYYYVSTEYSSYQEMVNDFKKYATEDIITSGSNAKEYYVEEDGKLYCEDFQKGNPYSYIDSEVQINEQSDTMIKATFNVKLNAGFSLEPDDYEYKNYEVIFEKDSNGNYIITSINKI